jgi:hypothetical protein
MSDYPDRATTDPDVAANLSIVQVAANLALIERNAALTEIAAELASDLYACAVQADADHATIRRLSEQLALLQLRVWGA